MCEIKFHTYVFADIIVITIFFFFFASFIICGSGGITSSWQFGRFCG